MENQARPVTVEELDKIIDEMTSLRLEIEKFEEEVKTRNKTMTNYKVMVAQFLKELSRESFVGRTGWKIYQKNKWSVKMPESAEDKLALFAYLKEQGVFEKYATVNYQSLNSYYVAEKEAAEARGEGMEFSLPGIGPATLFEDIILEKPRSKK